jgi:hypothetical protein
MTTLKMNSSTTPYHPNTLSKPYNSFSISTATSSSCPPYSYLNIGDLFTGYQKSLSKKSEYFFAELDLTVTSVNINSGILSGILEKKTITISGKKHC